MPLRTRLAACIALLVPPGGIKNWLLARCGWKLERGCRVGFSWVRCSRVSLGERVRIGHGNVIESDALVMREGSYVAHFNRLRGPLWIVLQAHAGIGNQNTVTRVPRGIVWGRSMLKIGAWSKLTVGHFIDCTRSVKIGEYSILAGRGSQIWTHGYLHAPQGIDRFRVDGRVSIGSNVYVGSACVINAGVAIGDAITVGAATCVPHSIQTPGLYVSQPLRMVPLDYGQAQRRYPAVQVGGLVERVFNKHPGPGK